MTQPLTILPPSAYPCPQCERLTLDYDIKPKITCDRTTMFGMFALEVKVKHLPVIYCTAPTCDFQQWGKIDGLFAVFDGTPEAK